MRNLLLFAVIFLVIQLFSCIMLKKECPTDETHKSCSFFDEYTCWEDVTKQKRVMILPQRHSHCKSGCFCKKGLVRAYPQGYCIMAPFCRNERVEVTFQRIPQK